jgi:Ni,Fe-hydrogenase III component G
MNVSAFPLAVTDAFPGCHVDCTSPRRLWVDIDREGLVAAMKTVRERLGLVHLSTIVGEDMGDHFLVSYPFSGGPVLLTLRVKVDREHPEVPSLANDLVGALTYEREIHDLFGIVPVGHPDLRRQILPDDFPAGVFPLRKDVKMPRFGDAPQSNLDA